MEEIRPKYGRSSLLTFEFVRQLTIAACVVLNADRRRIDQRFPRRALWARTYGNLLIYVRRSVLRAIRSLRSAWSFLTYVRSSHAVRRDRRITRAWCANNHQSPPLGVLLSTTVLSSVMFQFRVPASLERFHNTSIGITISTASCGLNCVPVRWCVAPYSAAFRKILSSSISARTIRASSSSFRRLKSCRLSPS